jgi:G3E family GTPase
VAARVSVVIVTGYLGSGKTTLLRRLIERSGMRLAIVMNEFGELAIDSQVLSGKNILMAELAGGCVCCSLVGEFEAAIKEIVETVHPEEIVIETTGVAEPDALVGDIQENLPIVILDAVVTVVDADAMVRYPAIGHTGRVQIRMADLILLNKVDLVPEDIPGKLRNTLRDLNPAALIFESVRCQIDPGLIFGQGLEKGARKVPALNQIHEHRIESFEVTPGGTISRTGFERLLSNLPAAIYRAKGFVRFEDGMHLWNYVAGRSELEAWPNEEVKSGIVFIGEEALSLKSEIEGELKRCLSVG